MIQLQSKGEWKYTSKYLGKLKDKYYMHVLDRYGKLGVEALKASTPVDTGLTANSWYYTIEYNPEGATIQYNNSNRNKGVMIAIILQYGHGTGTGGWVEGVDYINPALQPVFEDLCEKLWKEVTSL